MDLERGGQQLTAGHAGCSWKDSSLSSCTVPLVEPFTEIFILSVIETGFSLIKSVDFFERNRFFVWLGFFSCNSEIPLLSTLKVCSFQILFKGRV